MTQEKLTQTLADSLTHTTEHFPSIVIGFLYRFCFFFTKLNATICCPHFIFHERVGQVMVRSLGFGFILLWSFNIFTHTNTQTHGVTHFAIEVQYKNLIDVLAVAMRRIYIFRFSFAVF